ncbi:hypothetical protein FIU94_03355 [Sulfitobacter sp. THAF37]|uniref:hypothetical protein n=1 Tax=Sulfitobacter sp. THAF37 TaxID=2587855 RepID=UPI0012AA75BF|nr:hypothetical protein [Sulfitobacter sp. THAF37]QFT57852.1 hypothetical protein FIU94_03355 [Sulfitobacter sp. THAF37]
MKPFLVLFAAVALVGCNSPSPEFSGAAPTRVTVEGSTFDVRLRDGRAEAIRVNMQYAPRFGPIRAQAGAAMAMVSGCRVVEVTGDQAQAFGRLDCGDGAPPKRRRAPRIDCIPIPGSKIATGGEVSVQLDCAVL